MSTLQILPKALTRRADRSGHSRTFLSDNSRFDVAARGSHRALSRGVVFKLCFIAAVSICDTWLIHRYNFTLPQLEQNPIGLWLIECGNGDVHVFIRTKLAGSFIVLVTLLAMWRLRFRWAISVTNTIATFQLLLLGYLFLS